MGVQGCKGVARLAVGNAHNFERVKKAIVNVRHSRAHLVEVGVAGLTRQSLVKERGEDVHLRLQLWRELVLVPVKEEEENNVKDRSKNTLSDQKQKATTGRNENNKDQYV